MAWFLPFVVGTSAGVIGTIVLRNGRKRHRLPKPKTPPFRTQLTAREKRYEAVHPRTMSGRFMPRSR